MSEVGSFVIIFFPPVSVKNRLQCLLCSDISRLESVRGVSLLLEEEWSDNTVSLTPLLVKTYSSCSHALHHPQSVLSSPQNAPSHQTPCYCNFTFRLVDVQEHSDCTPSSWGLFCATDLIRFGHKAVFAWFLFAWQLMPLPTRIRILMPVFLCSALAQHLDVATHIGHLWLLEMQGTEGVNMTWLPSNCILIPRGSWNCTGTSTSVTVCDFKSSWILPSILISWKLLGSG